jgi:NAD(P)-dependent dehydrogenase (short-subunit alcohol dehydrogenase family)
MPTPESILNVVLFLASDYAQHMTGQDINVTAGMRFLHHAGTRILRFGGSCGQGL